MQAAVYYSNSIQNLYNTHTHIRTHKDRLTNIHKTAINYYRNVNGLDNNIAGAVWPVTDDRIAIRPV